MKKTYRLFIPVFIILGIAAIMLLANTRKSPQRPDIVEEPRPVNIVEVEKMSFVPKVTGYGYVVPVETWEAIPEVSGRIIEVHPELKRGTFVAKGELLVRIDPEAYGLAQRRGVADLMSSEAQLKELEQEEVNLKKLLDIEEETLKLVEKDFARKSNLFEQGVISASELEKEKQNLLAQQTAVNNLKNNLALLPAQQNALLAQKESSKSSLSELDLDIEKTILRAPFDCRIAEVNIEKDQFATSGQAILKAISIRAVEIPVQLSPNDFINLLSTPTEQEAIVTENFSMDKFRDIIGIQAQVRLPLFSREATWPGEFRRTGESLDLQTGALTIFVAVDNPYDQVIPGVRPPLVPNMFCEVELRGNPRNDRFLVPLHAVHGDMVYTVDENNRLKRQQVEIEMIMGDIAVISNDLQGQLRIITTDLIPAIEGQLLEPILNEALMTEIANFAARE